MQKKRKYKMVKNKLCICNKEAEISTIKTKVGEIHTAFFGNGQPGMYQEFNQTKGAIILLKWLFGISTTLAITSLGILTTIYIS